MGPTTFGVLLLIIGFGMAGASSYTLRKKRVPALKEEFNKSRKGGKKTPQTPAPAHQSQPEDDPAGIAWTWIGRIGTVMAMVGFILTMKGMQ